MTARRVAVITGGTSGIGLAAAQVFLHNGYDVALIGRSGVKGEAALNKLRADSARVVFHQGDISRASECRRLIDAVIKSLGRLDVLVNSAGVYLEKAINETTENDYDKVMDVNVRGTYFMCRYAVDPLRQSRAGAIVNLSSDAGLNGNFLCSAYCAAKGAVTIFTKALALELAPYKVRVNCVCPGDIDTPMTRAQFRNQEDVTAELREMSALYPLGRIGKAQEVAEVIYFLATEKAGFVTGAAWSIDGGITAY